jgi:biotin transport system substrate-specific component
MVMNHYSFTTALTIGFLPFLPLDFLKAIVAAQVIPAFRRLQNMN